MRTGIDQMIDLATVFSSDVRLSKSVHGKYMVSIHRVSWKENSRDCMSRGICGYGSDLPEACEDFLSYARGKLLFGDDRNFYGENRPEYICV